MKPRVCCCGCMSWEHAGGVGQCRRCSSCVEVHHTGDCDDGRAFKGFCAAMVGLFFFTVYGLWRTSTTHMRL